MKQKTWIEISESALQSNIHELKRIIGDKTNFLGVIKANAYGLGIEPIVLATKSIIDWYGVDSLDEAILVRRLCQKPILILGYVSSEDVAEVISGNFSVVVYDYDFALALSRKATKDNPAKIHIKIDTGLIRLGVYPEEAIILAEKVSKLPNIIIEGIYTHYARLINGNNVEIYNEQLKKFNFVLRSLSDLNINPKVLHTASSMAAILYEDTRFNMVRIGVLLYGFWGRGYLDRLISEKGIYLKLCSAITWKTTVVNVKKIPANIGVGYGHSEVVSRETVVAVLGAGCYDGIDKRYGMAGHVLIRGKRAKVLGSISMNMFMVDVTDIEDIKIGDIAVLIGRSGEKEITIYEFADTINTSTYEIISRINPLLPRILIT